MAQHNGVGEIYEKLALELTARFDHRNTTRSSMAFIGMMEQGRRVILSLLPGKSDSHQGLLYQVYADRYAEYLGIDKKTALDTLPSYRKQRRNPDDWAGEFGEGFFKGEGQIEEFLTSLTEFRKH